MGCRGSCARPHGFTSLVLAGGWPNPEPLALGKPRLGKLWSPLNEVDAEAGAGAEAACTPPRPGWVSPARSLNHARGGQNVLHSGPCPSFTLLHTLFSQP